MTGTMLEAGITKLSRIYSPHKLTTKMGQVQTFLA